MEVLKQAMLRQDAVFRHQVRELHRLYWTQKNLLVDLRKRSREECWQAVGSTEEHFKRLRSFDLQIPVDVGLNLNVGSAVDSIQVSASIQEDCPFASLDGPKEIGIAHDINLFPIKSHLTSRVHIDLNESLDVECSENIDDLSPSSSGDNTSLIVISTHVKSDNAFKDSSSFVLKASSPKAESTLKEDSEKLEKSDNDSNTSGAVGKLQAHGCTDELEDWKCQYVSSDSRMQTSVMTSSHEAENLDLGNESNTARAGCTGTGVLSVSEESESNQAVDSVVRNSTKAQQACLPFATCKTEELELEEQYEVLGLEILKAAEMLVHLSLQCTDCPTEPKSEHFSDMFELTSLKLQECRDYECKLSERLPYVNAKSRDSCGVGLRRGNFRLQDFQKDMLPGLVSLSRHEIREDLRNLRCAVGRERNSNRTGLLLPVKSRRSRPPAAAAAARRQH